MKERKQHLSTKTTLLCWAAPSHKHPSVFRVCDFAEDGPVWRGHIWRSFCCFLLSCPAELQPPHGFSRQVQGGPLCPLATCGWAAAIPRGSRQAKAEASLHALSEFLSLLSSHLNPGSAVPIAGVIPGSGSQPGCPWEASLGQTLLAHDVWVLDRPHLSDAGGEAGLDGSGGPSLLPSGSVADGWPSRSEEKQADLSQELQRQLLANWATASTASFLRSCCNPCCNCRGSARRRPPLSCQAGHGACCPAMGQRQLGTPLSLCL